MKDKLLRSPTGSENESLECFRQKHNLIGIVIGKSTRTDENYEAAGIRRRGSGDRMDAGDMIPVLSMTKAMTATLLMLLVKDGLFTWHTTLGDLLPDYAELHPSLRDLDLKHLAAHRSGITETEGLVFGNRRPWQDPKLSAVDSRELFVRETLVKPTGAARGTFKYNNVNYMILGFVIDRTTRSSWETVIMDRLFHPLGMNGVVFGNSPATGPVAIGHIPNPLPLFQPFPAPSVVQRLFAMIPAVNPAGGVRCTLQDLTKFLRFHADGVHGSEVLGLRTEDFRFLHTPFTTEDVQGVWERYTWGGWVRPFAEDQGDNNYSIWHPGGFLWFSFRGYVDVRAGACYTAMTNIAFVKPICPLDEVVTKMRSGSISWQKGIQGSADL